MVDIQQIAGDLKLSLIHIYIYMTNPANGALAEQEKILPGCWVHLCDPTPEEIGRVSSCLSIDRDFLAAALDEEERSRLEVEDGNTLVLVDTPTVETQGPNFVYNTLPFGIILTEENIVTVCLKEVEMCIRDRSSSSQPWP